MGARPSPGRRPGAGLSEKQSGGRAANQQRQPKVEQPAISTRAVGNRACTSRRPSGLS